MKKHVCVLLVAALLATVFTGCGVKAEALEETLERKLEKWEETIENAVKPEPARSAEPAQTTAPARIAASLTAWKAEEIALQDAGLTSAQADRLRSEYDVDHGIPEFDVEFRHGGWEYEYEIHGTTGEILFKDVERDD